MRITSGLVGVMTSLIMLTFFFNLVPDRNQAVYAGRASLAEAIAIYSTALVKTANVRSASSQRLADDFKLLVERNPDLLSLALRHDAGHLLVYTGDHAETWQSGSGEFSEDSQVRVPIWAGTQRWGQLELRFQPLSAHGFWGLLFSPMAKMVGFVAFFGFVVFYFYLGKVLRQLDPSQAIPGRVRSALDTMAEGLLILDRKEQIVLANQAFSTIIQKSAESLLGFRAGELPWVDESGKPVEKSNRPWVLALAQGTVRKDSTIRLQLSKDEVRTFKTNSSPVLGNGGKYAGVLVSFDDVTELEEKEIELINSKLEAEEANRAKSTFLANMSHEIRTPMNAILGFTELLKRGYVKNEHESLRYLNTIHASGKNLLELINDILDLSKVESGRLEVEKLTVDPYTILHEVVQMLRVKANEKDLLLEFNAVGFLPATIETDPVRLRQIAFNLIGNSIKFTENGQVSVTCRYETTKTGPFFFIDITDTGIGMTLDAQKRIFDPFVQADNSVSRKYGGTGLGLAISQRFAKTMGGDILIKSELGRGSTFTVSLPTGKLDGAALVAAEELLCERIAEAVVPDARWSFKPARILVVDDGAENRELVRLFLEENGLTVDEAEHGQQAVDKAALVDYDVILMDVNMPVMDGFTAAGILRNRGFANPMIALTANAMKGYEEECLQAGYSGYLSKPINLDAFMNMMVGLLGGQSLDIQAVAEPSEAFPRNPESSVDLSPIYSKLPLHNEKFKNIVARFILRLEEQLCAMEAADASGNFVELANLAHWLKGAGGTVGFDAFTEPAALLETLAKEGRASQTTTLIAQLRTLAERIKLEK